MRGEQRVGVAWLQSRWQRRLAHCASLCPCPAGNWLVSKEKSPEGESEGPEPAWAAEGGPGKESLAGGRGAGTCWDLPVLRAPPARSSVARALLGRSSGRSTGAPTAARPFASALRPKNLAQPATLASLRGAHTAERAYAQCGRSRVAQPTLPGRPLSPARAAEQPCQRAEGRKRCGSPSAPWHRRSHAAERRLARLALLTVHLTVPPTWPGERAFRAPSVASVTCRSWLVHRQGSHASQAFPFSAACERGSQANEPPAGLLRGAVLGKPPKDPSAAPGSEGARPEQGHKGRPGGKQLSGSDQEGLRGSLLSSLPRLKMENAG